MSQPLPPAPAPAHVDTSGGSTTPQKRRTKKKRATPPQHCEKQQQQQQRAVGGPLASHQGARLTTPPPYIPPPTTPPPFPFPLPPPHFGGFGAGFGAHVGPRGFPYSPYTGAQPFMHAQAPPITASIATPVVVPSQKQRKALAVLFFGPPGAGCSTLARALATAQGMQLIIVNPTLLPWERAAELRRTLTHNASTPNTNAKGVVIDAPLHSRADLVLVYDALGATGGLQLGAAILVEDEGRGLRREAAIASNPTEAEYAAVKHSVHQANIDDLRKLLTTMGIFYSFRFEEMAQTEGGEPDAAKLQECVRALRGILFQAHLSPPKKAPFLLSQELDVPHAELVRNGDVFYRVMSALSGLLGAPNKRFTFPSHTTVITMVRETLTRFLGTGSPYAKPIRPDMATSKCLLVALGDSGIFVVPRTCTHIMSVPSGQLQQEFLTDGAPCVLWCSYDQTSINVEDCLVWNGSSVAHRAYAERVCGMQAAVAKHSRRGERKHAGKKLLHRTAFSHAGPVRFDPFTSLKETSASAAGCELGFELLDADGPFFTASRLAFCPAPEFDLSVTRDTASGELVIHAFVHGDRGASLAPLPTDAKWLAEGPQAKEGLLRCAFAMRAEDGSPCWTAMGPARRAVAHGWPTLFKAGVGRPAAELVLSTHAFLTLVREYIQSSTKLDDDRSNGTGSKTNRKAPQASEKSVERDQQRQVKQHGHSRRKKKEKQSKDSP